MVAPQPKHLAWSADRAAELMSAMGNRRRLDALLQLSHKECTVNELVEMIGISQSALSQHLAVLRRAQLVKTRREGQTIFYSIKSPIVLKILSELGAPVPRRL